MTDLKTLSETCARLREEMEKALPTSFSDAFVTLEMSPQEKLAEMKSTLSILRELPLLLDSIAELMKVAEAGKELRDRTMKEASLANGYLTRKENVTIEKAALGYIEGHVAAYDRAINS